jgi:sulfide:quinone oxidoreductase
MTRRVVVLGAGAAGLAAANGLGMHAGAGAELEVVLIDRSGEHVFAPGFAAVLFGDAEPGAFRRPVSDLARPQVRVLAGEVTRLDPRASAVSGSFGELAYDHLVVALGADVGWRGDSPPGGDLAPWTLEGALAGREELRRIRPGARVVVGPAGLAYRCPPAVFDLAARISRVTRARVDLVHPWPAPLAPFGRGPSAAFTAMLAEAGVGFHGGFTIAQVTGDRVTSSGGAVLPYDAAFLVPPHHPPAAIAGSPLAGPSGWPAVSYPALTHPAHQDVTIIGDIAAPALRAGMAGTLAVFQASHAADRIAAPGSQPGDPQMAAICFADPGDAASFLYCDFTGPAAGTGPPKCVLMPPLRYFRQAKQLFAREWFTSMLTGDAGTAWLPLPAQPGASRERQ